MNSCGTPGGTTTEAPGVGAHGLAVDAELERALEHVEAVGVPQVYVPARSVVLAVDEVLEDVEIRVLSLDERETVRLRQAIAVAGRADDRTRARRGAIRAERVVVLRRQAVRRGCAPIRRARGG